MKSFSIFYSSYKFKIYLGTIEGLKLWRFERKTFFLENRLASATEPGVHCVNADSSIKI